MFCAQSRNRSAKLLNAEADVSFQQSTRSIGMQFLESQKRSPNPYFSPRGPTSVGSSIV